MRGVSGEIFVGYFEENFGGKIDHYIFCVEINSQTIILKRNFKIHFEFRASLRNFQDLNFWGATSCSLTLPTFLCPQDCKALASLLNFRDTLSKGQEAWADSSQELATISKNPGNLVQKLSKWNLFFPFTYSIRFREREGSDQRSQKHYYEEYNLGINLPSWLYKTHGLI